jgi:hypothetical protein
MGPTSGQFVAELASQQRVLVIGGLAVIAHGLNRPTMDADIWLEPLDSPSMWADAVEQISSRFPGLSIHTLPGWRGVAGHEVADAAEEVGMIRVLGLDCPLDIFRRPNEFAVDAFAEVLSRSTRNTDAPGSPMPTRRGQIPAGRLHGRCQCLHQRRRSLNSKHPAGAGR